MDEMYELINHLLENRPDGMTAREISRELGVDRHAINSYLYSEEFRKFSHNAGTPPVWRLNTENENTVHEPRAVRVGANLDLFDILVERGPALKRLNNKDNARVFSAQQFEDMFSNEQLTHPGPHGQAFELPDGREIYVDSASEILMLKYLIGRDLVSDVSGQAFSIHYTGAGGNVNQYHPDIEVHLASGHIAIIELKAATEMPNLDSRLKYKALQRYCEEQGFMYAMIDPRAGNMDFEQLKNRRFRTTLEREAVSIMTAQNMISTQNYAALRNRFALAGQHHSFDLEMCSIAIKNNWHKTFHRWEFNEIPESLDI